MNPTVRDAIVGLTALVAIAGVAAMMLLFGEWAPAEEPRYEVTLELPTAEGLTRGSTVTLAGVPIGDIKTLEPAEFPARGAVLVLEVESDVRIPRDCDVQISVGLLGDATLTLKTPKDFDPRETPEEPSYIQPGERVAKDATTLLEELTDIFEERLIGLDEAAGALVRLSDTYTEVGGRLNELLEPRDPEEVDAGRVRPNVSSALARVSDAVASMEQWLGDESLRRDFSQTLSDLPPLIESASDAVADVQRAAESVRAQVDEVGGRFGELAANFSRAADDLSIILRDMEVVTGRLVEGDGTAGQLLNNPDLYRSLTESAERLEKALREAQLFFEKVKAEGLPLNL